MHSTYNLLVTYNIYYERVIIYHSAHKATYGISLTELNNCKLSCCNVYIKKMLFKYSSGSCFNKNIWNLNKIADF